MNYLNEGDDGFQIGEVIGLVFTSDLKFEKHFNLVVREPTIFLELL